MESFNQDPYEILAIHRDATESQIRKAYRHLAMRFHPDRNPDDPEAEERFKQVQWAYENLVGRRGQEGISSTALRRTRSGAPFSEAAHPFYGFFWAMRAFCAKKKDNKEATGQHGKENGGQNFPKDQ